MGISNFIKKITTSSTDHSNKQVSITPELDSIRVKHNGEGITISRVRNKDAKINPLFAKTNRPCPPFCVQPMTIADEVETIGELELLGYLQQSTTDKSLLIIDSRIKDWVDKGTIPGSINIPWTSLVSNCDESMKKVTSILTNEFDITIRKNNSLDFSKAKTLVLFCNGSWCGQTTESIQALLGYGYPAKQLKYYRDGMQGWESLGFTTVSLVNVCKIKEPECRTFAG